MEEIALLAFSRKKRLFTSFYRGKGLLFGAPPCGWSLYCHWGFAGPVPRPPMESPFAEEVKEKLAFHAGLSRILLILNILSQCIPWDLLLSHHSGHHHISVIIVSCLPAPNHAFLLPVLHKAATTILLKSKGDLVSSLLHPCADFLFTQTTIWNPYNGL